LEVESPAGILPALRHRNPNVKQLLELMWGILILCWVCAWIVAAFWLASWVFHKLFS
jgi:hypothetical protein